MPEVATRRLIDAAATLPPAERALLNLWVQRGLDDRALAGMTGISIQMIGERRQRIVEHLSGELGLPADHVQAALDRLAVPVPDAVPESQAEAEFEPEAQSRPTPTPPTPVTPPRRKRLRSSAAMAAAATATVIAVVVFAAASPSDRRAGGGRVAQTDGRTAAHASRPRTAALTGLPGGLTHAGGTVELVPGAKAQIVVTLHGLPLPRGGHYELWLYNSVLDSSELGPISGGSTDRASFALGPDARSYGWIDISFQPRGMQSHSGRSVLRATNPAAGG